ncbi:A1 cistron-splicing factor [Aspergillus desertorum]
MSSLTPTPALLIPHLPPKALVGIDLITFTSTPNIHGIRNIPPGWHFLYTGTTAGLSLRVGGWFYIDPDGNSAETETGKDILVWRWNDHIEALEPLGSHETGEGMRYRANIGGVWMSGGLWKYRSRVPAASIAADAEALRKIGGDANAGSDNVGLNDEEEEEGRREWTALTDRLSPQLLSRITGEPTLDWEGRARWVVTSGSTARQDDDVIPGLDLKPDLDPGNEGVPGAEGYARREDYIDRQFSFLPVDLKMTWREGAIGRERTEAARDRSWALGEIIHRLSSTSSLAFHSQGHVNGNDKDVNTGEAQILGELQFTFIMGLTLINYSCLQQWKRLLRLILTCRSAIIDRAPFMVEVLRLLLTQLKRADDVEGGFFDQLGNEGGAEGADFLRTLLKGFRTAMYEVFEDGEGEESPVKEEFGRLEEWVKRELDWELDRDAVLRKGMMQLEDGEEVELEMMDHEEEEYAPVVVELDGTY